MYVDPSGHYCEPKYETPQSGVGGEGTSGAPKKQWSTPEVETVKISETGSTSGSATDTTRVGRWMSRDEYNKMVETEHVQKPYNADQSYVANPADYNAFYKQTEKGNVYVEFDVPTSSLKQTKDIWATIPGPNSMYSKLNKLKGLPPYEFPKVTNIVLVGEK